MRVLDVCADDFGLGRERSSSQARLAAAGRVSSLSCLVHAPEWHACAAELAGVRVGVGLHFNLSEGEPLSPALRARWPRFPRLAALLAQAHLGRLPLAAIGDEWRAQLERFVAGVGRLPDHVDGHQHVHQLPGVRDIVLAACERLAPRPALRNTGRLVGPGDGLKRAVIAASGGRALARELRRRGLAHNAVLFGAYDFRAADYGARVRAWLRRVPPEGAQLYCHAALAGAGDAPDAIDAARAREYAYLQGADFPRDLAAAQVTLGTAWRL